jgi:hypothetical protein
VAKPSDSESKVQSWPNLAPRDGQRFEMRTLFSAGAKRAENSVKRRQIRRPFHSDVHLLRSYNPGEKSGVECISGQRLSSIVYHAALSLPVMRDMTPIQEVGVELGDSVLINPTSLSSIVPGPRGGICRNVFLLAPPHASVDKARDCAHICSD